MPVKELSGAVTKMKHVSPTQAASWSRPSGKSIMITILSFIESIAVPQKFADKHGWFQIYPVSGVLSLAT